MEALGLNRWFVNACQQRGFDLVVADPVQLGLKASGKKTDRRDARELARRLMLGDIERSARTYFPTDAEYGVRKLLRSRHKLVSLRQQVVNQIRGILNAHLVAIDAWSLYSPKGLKVLRSQHFEDACLGNSKREETGRSLELLRGHRALEVARYGHHL